MGNSLETTAESLEHLDLPRHGWHGRIEVTIQPDGKVCLHDAQSAAEPLVSFRVNEMNDDLRGALGRLVGNSGALDTLPPSPRDAEAAEERALRVGQVEVKAVGAPRDRKVAQMLGVDRKHINSDKAFLRLGVTSDLAEEGDKLLAPRNRTIDEAHKHDRGLSKQEKLLGYAEGQLGQAKAMQLMGLDEESLDKELTYRLGAIGVNFEERHRRASTSRSGSMVVKSVISTIRDSLLRSQSRDTAHAAHSRDYSLHEEMELMKRDHREEMDRVAVLLDSMSRKLEQLEVGSIAGRLSSPAGSLKLSASASGGRSPNAAVAPNATAVPHVASPRDLLKLTSPRGGDREPPPRLTRDRRRSSTSNRIIFSTTPTATWSKPLPQSPVRSEMAEAAAQQLLRASPTHRQALRTVVKSPTSREGDIEELSFPQTLRPLTASSPRSREIEEVSDSEIMLQLRPIITR
eukprot:CAMPEP_0118870512 /NCGR_PEP_ID=MMETSP1163-20130328/13450_1 /TAXON_ID=124430 /ORGANISM="Phaeomonas parva, Strain CCMP2877" /LENGTH=459 /DNA_ID=CAMNT_0006805525 /DNA_START=211 /DNA_END=1590 /DNA_ORIENTATION=-